MTRPCAGSPGQRIRATYFTPNATTLRTLQGKGLKQHILHRSHNFPGSLGQTTYFIPKTTTLGTPQGKQQTYIIPQAMTLPTDTPGRTTCFAVRATTFWAPQGKALKQHISKQSPHFSGSPGATAFSDQKPQLSQLPRAKVQKKHISAENHDVLKFRRTDHVFPAESHAFPVSTGQRTLLRQTTCFQVRAFPLRARIPSGHFSPQGIFCPRIPNALGQATISASKAACPQGDPDPYGMNILRALLGLRQASFELQTPHSSRQLVAPGIATPLLA